MVKLVVDGVRVDLRDLRRAAAFRGYEPGWLTFEYDRGGPLAVRRRTSSSSTS